MSRSGRFAVFLVGGGGLAVLVVLATLRLPAFGTAHHPYRGPAVASAVAHGTSNAVSSVNFDQRAIDTLGEESILLGSVVGVFALLRPAENERERAPADSGSVLESTKLAGYLLFAVTLAVGVDVVAHGHISPGGGFQGGVVLSSAAYLLYVAGRYGALRRIRPGPLYEFGEGLGAGAFAGLGLAGVGVSGSFLADLLPNGSFGNLLSAGSVELLSIAVGIEVTCGTVILLHRFLMQAVALEEVPEGAEEGR